VEKRWSPNHVGTEYQMINVIKICFIPNQSFVHPALQILWQL